MASLTHPKPRSAPSRQRQAGNSEFFEVSSSGDRSHSPNKRWQSAAFRRALDANCKVYAALKVWQAMQRRVFDISQSTMGRLMRGLGR
jgi:hypothetical protein